MLCNSANVAVHTKYKYDVRFVVKPADLGPDANADALAPCAIAVLYRVAASFAVTAVFAAAATHAIQRVPRRACPCAPCASARDRIDTS